MVTKKKCSVCGQLYIEDDGLPPCTVRFLYKQFYADLCLNCGIKVFQYLKDLRFKKSESLSYVT